MMWRRAAPAAALLALAANAAVAQPVGPGGGWGDRPWMMMHGGWGWGCGLAWLVTLVALVSLAVVLLRRRAPGAASAVEALDLRYARGEVERDEYLRRKADLLGRG
ncbi:SHOCT domain-containing protein [Elioraea tepidiphila]|jgi:putative membrane protein|uniref:SHOCT domain-containing protein n=1 Tax=Elioraea tepidiphila TaxID=457934 RepID=UPI0012EB59BE|nr:SHOCT domain-containing protein [Elioraea tepidiphila]